MTVMMTTAMIRNNIVTDINHIITITFIIIYHTVPETSRVQSIYAVNRTCISGMRCQQHEHFRPTCSSVSQTTKKTK